VATVPHCRITKEGIMADDHARDELAQLRAQVATLQARMDRPRRRLPRRVLPLALVALLVALMPLSLLAANPFNDLTGGVHDANIDAIYNAGITTGCVPNVSYCPTANVTREEMASFLARTAGLGTNPPVANAKTAQTANTATNATSAGNANTVGGYAPNGLVRVARGAAPGLTPVAPALTPGAFTTLATVNLTVPAPGFVLVTGGTIVEGTGTGIVRLRDAASTTNVSPFLGVDVDPTTTDNSATPTWVFQVTTAGPQSYVLEAQGPITLVAGGPSAQITALYVPFGSTGTTASGAGEAPPAAPAPGSGPLLRP
jgi:hypothetical protein